MEFNQDKHSLKTTVTVLDTVAEQLTDVDLTLPDYCPDIDKILKCTLTPKIQSKILSGGQLQVEGFCVVNVLYVESTKKSIRCCEQSVNFSQSFSLKETPENPVIITKTKSEYINCRALSPRRLVMHGAFSLYAKVLSSIETNIYTPKSENKLETNVLSVKSVNLVSLCQEQFNISEEIAVGDKPAVEAILHSSVSVNITDSKAVTGKLMVNGEINLKMLYITDVESGDTAKIDYILPFNQIIDCEGIDENTVNCLNCEVMSYDIRLKNDVVSEKPSVLLDLKICITEEGYVTSDENIIIDAYSVEYNTRPRFDNISIISDISCINDSHIEKTSVGISDGKISKIINIYSDYINADCSFADGILKANGKMNICILALNEDNIPVFIERNIDYSHNINAESDYNNILAVYPRVASISYRLADDNNVELRCEIKASRFASSKMTVRAVEDVDVYEDKPIKADSCALTLYFAEKGEMLWDIAKAHNTRLDLLIEENNAEKQVVDAPCMLLIPRV